MSSYFVDKELYDNIEANFNDLTIRYEHLKKVADERMNTILKIEQYLIDSGVDDETLEYCDIYDVNGVELRKYIEELKEGK